MNRFTTPLALALCAAAQAQSIYIDQNYNFGTGVPITTNSGGQWEVSLYTPRPAAHQLPQFVTNVVYDLRVSSSISFTFNNDLGSTGDLSFDPRAGLGPYSINGPVPSMGVVGQQVQVSSVDAGSLTPIFYSEVNTSIAGTVPVQPYDPVNRIGYNVLTIRPLQSGDAITFTFPGGTTQTFNKTSSQVSGYSESFVLSGTVYVRYDFPPAMYTQVCPGNGSAVLGVYGDQTAISSVLGLTNLPPNVPAVFVQADASMPMAPNGICLANPFRMNNSMNLANSAGVLVRQVHNNGVFLSGQTYYFQGWYRTPGPGNAFSNAVSVTFL